MSMENAILELASGMKELAAAVRESCKLRAHADIAMAAGQAATALADFVAEDPVQAKAAELAVATEKRATAAREAQQKDAAANAEVKGTTTAEAAANQAQIEAERAIELEAAVSKVEEAARAEAAPLDYAKDVKPVLLALVKAKQKPALVDLLAKYNAKNGEQIKADDFAKIVADANALIAA